jgi:hypothetical protein
VPILRGSPSRGRDLCVERWRSAYLSHFCLALSPLACFCTLHTSVLFQFVRFISGTCRRSSLSSPLLIFTLSSSYADIKLQDGSFHIDFMMTVRTEEYAFQSTADALATFNGGPRDCSPWKNETRLSGTPLAALGTGSLNTQGQEPNSAPYLSPTQYVMIFLFQNLGCAHRSLSSV